MGGSDSFRYREFDVSRYGPTALVTGASEGIGEAFARSLAVRGLDLVLVARRADRLDALASELRAAHPIKAMTIAADLSRSEDMARVLDQTRHRDIGLLIAAAGFGSSGQFLDRALSVELGMIDLNCRSVVALCHAMGERFAARGKGGIVLMSSLVGFQGAPHAATYCATKSFVQSFAEGLAAELKPRGIDVVASAPGPVGSGFAARAGMQMGSSDTPAVVAAGTLAALGRRLTVRPGPLGKLLGYSLMTLPRPARVRMMGAIMKRMSGGQSAVRAASERPVA